MVMPMKMKVFASKIYGDIPEPSSFEELIELTLDPAPAEYWFARMWRGQADIDWPLHSTAYRRLLLARYLSGGIVPDESDLVEYE